MTEADVRREQDLRRRIRKANMALARLSVATEYLDGKMPREPVDRLEKIARDAIAVLADLRYVSGREGKGQAPLTDLISVAIKAIQGHRADLLHAIQEMLISDTGEEREE